MPTNAEINRSGGGGGSSIPGGADTQLQYNNAGVFAGLPSLTTDGTNLSLSGLLTLSKTGGSTEGAAIFTGLPPTGVSAKPTLLLEQTGTTAGTWSTNGTFLGINAPTAYAGSLQSWRVAGVEKAWVDKDGLKTPSSNLSAPSLQTGSWGIASSIASSMIIGAGGITRWTFHEDYLISASTNGARITRLTGASSPSFSFVGDENTGMYRIGADNLGITCGGVKQVDISTSLVTFTNAIKTGAPGGAAGEWRLGIETAGVVALDTANYVEISIGGVVKKLLIAS